MPRPTLIDCKCTRITLNLGGTCKHEPISVISLMLKNREKSRKIAKVRFPIPDLILGLTYCNTDLRFNPCRQLIHHNYFEFRSKLQA